MSSVETGQIWRSEDAHYRIGDIWNGNLAECIEVSPDGSPNGWTDSPGRSVSSTNVNTIVKQWTLIVGVQSPVVNHNDEWLKHVLNERTDLRIALERALADNRQLTEQLTVAQARCTELVNERRATLRSRVREFFTIAGQRIHERVEIPSEAELRLGLSIVAEECGELLEACLSDDGCTMKMVSSATPSTTVEMRYAPGRLKRLFDQVESFIRYAPIQVDLPKAIDACGDIDFVVEGVRVRFGVDGGPIAEAIATANLAKVGGPKDPVTQKHLKPPGWTPPDIDGCLKAQGWKGSEP